MRGHGARYARFLVALAAWQGMGCASRGPIRVDDDAGDDASDETASTTGPEEPYPSPVLLEPSSDAVRIDPDRTEPLLLSALGTVAGRSQISVDGRTVAVADQLSPYGSLSGGIGRVDLRGAMVESRHTLRIVTPGETARLESRAVDLVIMGGTPGRVTLATTMTRLSPNALGGMAALGEPTDDDPSLPPSWWTWAARDLDPSLGLAKVRVSFTRAGATERVLDLEDVTRDADGRPWVRVGPATRDDTAVVAWLSGPEARVAWRRVIALDTAGEAGMSPAVVLVDLDDPGVEALAPTRYEVAALRGLDLLAGRVLVQLDARLDAEAARPGDRGLIAFDPVPSDDATDATPLLGADEANDATVSFGGPIDAELLGRMVDVDAMARGVDGLAARIAGDRPRPVEWQDGVATLRVSDDDARDGRPAIASRWLGATVVLGSLASRTWLARTTTDGLEVARYDARALIPTVQSIVLDAPLRSTPPAVVLRGRVVALAPLGNDVDAAALTISGGNRRLDPVDGLRCTWAAFGPVSEDGLQARWICGDGLAVREGVATWSPDE